MRTYTTINEITFGIPIAPIVRIETFSPSDWEIFTEEWLDTRKEEYVDSERFGGANDKGRDVVAYVTDRNQEDYVWDCYQCKHYDHALMPSDILQEIGKILFYTYRGDYSLPRNYYLVSPKGCGTKLSNLLDKPDELLKLIIEKWDENCKNNITKKEVIELEGEFKNYVENFNYNIFKKIPSKLLIEEHKKHSNHLMRFGGGLASRNKDLLIPEQLQDYENRYISQLLAAYSSSCTTTFNKTEDLNYSQIHKNHFERARLKFHSAEQLRNLYRDSVPIGTFEDLQDEIYSGVINTVEEEFINGFKRVKAVEDKADVLQITSNPLISVSILSDRGGICHQLVNEGRLNWIDNG